MPPPYPGAPPPPPYPAGPGQGSSPVGPWVIPLAWLCLLVGLAPLAWHPARWLPAALVLVFAAVVLCVVAMCRKRVLGGTLTLVSVLVLSPIVAIGSAAVHLSVRLIDMVPPGVPRNADPAVEPTAPPDGSVYNASPVPEIDSPPPGNFADEVNASRKRAAQKHPDLAVPGSRFNATFFARYSAWKDSHNPRLESSDWPEQLSDECALDP